MSKSTAHANKNSKPDPVSGLTHPDHDETARSALRRLLSDAFRLSKESDLPLVSYLVEMAILEMTDARQASNAAHTAKPGGGAHR